jgi:hypothetical protein
MKGKNLNLIAGLPHGAYRLLFRRQSRRFCEHRCSESLLLTPWLATAEKGCRFPESWLRILAGR